MQPFKIMRIETMQRLASVGTYMRDLLKDMAVRFIHMCSPRPIINSLIALIIIAIVAYLSVNRVHATYGLDHIFYYLLGFSVIVTLLKSSLNSLLLPVAAIVISFLPLSFLHISVTIFGWSGHLGAVLLMVGLIGIVISTLFIQN